MSRRHRVTESSNVFSRWRFIEFSQKFVHTVTLQMSEKVPVLTLACASAYTVFLFANACLRHMHIHEYAHRVLHLKDVKPSKNHLFAPLVMYCT